MTATTMTRDGLDNTSSINGGTAARKQTVRLTLLARAAELLLGNDTLEIRMGAVFRLVAPHIGLDSYWDYDSTEAGNGLRLASSAGLLDEMIPAFQYLRYGQSLCGTCAQERVPLIVHDLQDSVDPEAALVKQNGNQAYACYPLMAGEQLLGTLGFASCGRTAFDREDIDFLGTIARYVANVKARRRTEMRLAVEARRREEMLLRAQRAAKAGLWEIDLRTNRLTWSDAYYELFALDRNTEPSIDGWLARIHPDDRQAVKAQYERAIAEEQDQDFEYRILLADGTVRWVHRKGQIDRNDQGRPMRLSGLTFDVTERKRAEEALRASEERWQLAVNGSTDGMWDWDPRSNKVFFSSRWKTLRGYSEDEIGDDAGEWSSRIHPDDFERVMRTIQLYFANRIPLYECEYRSRCKDGSYRWINDRGQAVWDERGQVLRMVGSEVDISARKRAEEALRKFNQELEQRVEQRTQELVRSQGRLRALATELNLSEQRQRQRLSEDLHDYLAQLLVFVRLKLNQAKRSGIGQSSIQFIAEADATLIQALTYTRSLIAELSPPVLRDFGLVVALQWLADQMRRHEMIVALERHVDEVSVPEEQAVLLFQSVRELLINVSKHAGTDHAVVTVGEADGMLCIEVKDQGRGFDLHEALLADSEASESSRYGLFSIRERMSAMGGDFDLDSAPGRGTKATLVLPLTPKPANAELGMRNEELGVKRNEKLMEPAATESPSPHSSFHIPHPSFPHRSPVRVLLADDHAMLRQGLRSVLDAYADVEVVGEASDGDEAIRLAQSLQPEIVVMDVNMPGMDGIEATRQLRHEQPTIAVVGLSVHNNPRVEQAMREAGAAAFLTKESAVEQLYVAIRDALGWRK